MDKLIKNIIHVFPTKDVKNIYTIIKNYNSNDWIKYKKTTDDYTKKIIYQNKYFEAVLISWNKNTSTEIHSHPKYGCLLKVLDGQLVETVYNKDNIITNVLNKNDIGYRSGGECHTIKATKNSHSLHIYSPPGFYK
jgi:hypothetical protein